MVEGLQEWVAYAAFPLILLYGDVVHRRQRWETGGKAESIAQADAGGDGIVEVGLRAESQLVVFVVLLGV